MTNQEWKYKLLTESFLNTVTALHIMLAIDAPIEHTTNFRDCEHSVCKSNRQVYETLGYHE